MAKVDFSKDIYKLLGTLTEEGDVLPYPDWDVLKELDRRAKRKHRDGGKRVREYMRSHPREVEKVREEHSKELARVFKEAGQ